MARKKRMRVCADFETTVDPEDVRVWASCAVDIDTLETVHLSNSIEAFFDWLKDKNTVAYFHNLKFDGEFILAYLLREGYKYSEKPKDNTFSTLITDTGAFYSITVIFKAQKKHYKKVVFYDSLKKLPFKVDTISKAFKLPDEKLLIDYKAYRPVGHELTEEEKKYIINDCKIVAEALQIQFSQGLTKMTNASDAMSHFKKTGYMEKYFEKYFPVFNFELDDFIRKAYKGGYVYLNPKYKNIRGLQGMTFDVNSLYPAMMYANDWKLPYGYPIYFEGEPETTEDYPLFIVHLKCKFKLKKDHLPTIQLKNNRSYVETEYLTTSAVNKNGVYIDEPVDITLTNVDLDLFLDHYETDGLKYIKGLKFRGRSDFFRESIDYWMHIKETSEGAIRQLAKLQLNSLYGRFAMSMLSRVKIPTDEEGMVKYKLLTEDTYKDLGLKEPELRDPVYTAMSAFIAASGRNNTIRSGQAVYDRFIYADTDSLHLVGTDIPENLDVHPTKLGAWKHEGTFTDSVFIRCKTYMETYELIKPRDLKTLARWVCDDSIERIVYEKDVLKAYTTKVTCAGMPDNIKAEVTYDNFKSGSTFDGKLMPKRYPGGVVLTETTFTIK